MTHAIQPHVETIFWYAAASLTTPMPHAEAAHVQGPVREILLSALVTSAAALVAAVLRSLVGPYGIGRVHRAASALCHLHMLAAQRQHSPQQASAWLQSLLEGALGSLQQEGHVAPDVAQRL